MAGLRGRGASRTRICGASVMSHRGTSATLTRHQADSLLTPHDIRLPPAVCMECWHATFQGTTVNIGQRRIANLLGAHTETVNLALHELEDREHICIRGAAKARCIYHLCSLVFGQKQRAGFEEVISRPSCTPRLASVGTD